ncbi:MAG: DUF115 domain-containing protein [Chloroflexi bacterium]|nr:DUF115 domain-containing protein [Chloroflexota bacterium]
MDRQTLKRITPHPVWNVASQTYWWWYNRGRHVFLRSLSPAWRHSQQLLRQYRDLHQGQRCFIIGNGPSLRQMDLSLLKNEVTFGLNRIYLLFPELGFTTTYLVLTNTLVLEQSAPELQRLQLPKFFTWRAHSWFANDPQAIFLDTDFTGPENFCPDATGRIFEGFTVTYTAMELAFYMGFNQVILIGVDHNYQASGPANSTVVSQGDDPNHFAANYFGKGFRWQLPDLEGSERSYRLARQAYQDAGRSIVDATVGGKLTIFPKADYRSFFSS